MLLVRHSRVSANLHAHLVNARVLEQREVGIEQPGRKHVHTHVHTQIDMKTHKLRWKDKARRKPPQISGRVSQRHVLEEIDSCSVGDGK